MKKQKVGKKSFNVCRQSLKNFLNCHLYSAAVSQSVCWFGWSLSGVPKVFHCKFWLIALLANIRLARKNRLSHSQKIGGKWPNFLKNSQNSCQGQKIYIEPQYESPKHPHHTTFETLKYLQQTMI